MNKNFNEEEIDFNIFENISLFDNTEDNKEKEAFYYNYDNEEDNISDGVSTLNSSSKENSLINEDEDEEGRKIKLLPFKLLEIEFNCDKEIQNMNKNEESKDFLNELNINSKPYYPKKRLLDKKVSINKNELKQPLIYPYKIYNKNNNFNYKNNHNKKEKNKKKKSFRKEGDWLCYKCKNINFAFRDKCNKCGMPVEESENLFIKVLENCLNYH